MQTILRVIVYSTHADIAPALRRTITSLPQVRIVAELDEPSLIPQAVAQFPADLLLVDLDPSPAVVLECLRPLRETSPHLPIFVLSEHTEGDVVLRAMKSGVREFLVKVKECEGGPLNLDEYRQAVSSLIDLLPKTKQPGKLISIIGSSGGVGCTTLATNLAVELADLVEENQKVALVDLDFRFGHVATLLDLHGQFTVADLCATPEELDPQMVMKALVRHETGLYVLRRPHTFAQAEMITAAHCANVLSSLQELCAYVVVDGPTRHDPGGRSVLDAADFVFLLLQLTVTCVRNADRIIHELAAQGFNAERISLVGNRIGRESTLLDLHQVETILNKKVLATIVDEWKSVSSSINIGQPLRTHCEKSRVRMDMRNLALRIHDPSHFADEQNKKSGLIDKLLRRGARTTPPAKPQENIINVPQSV